MNCDMYTSPPPAAAVPSAELPWLHSIVPVSSPMPSTTEVGASVPETITMPWVTVSACFTVL